MKRVPRTLRRGLAVLAALFPLAAPGQIMNMQFDLTEIGRGVDTVTATITVKNPTGVSLTYYVGGLTQLSGSSGFYLFSPTRQSITLSAGQTADVNLTWSPGSGTALGFYDFHCRLYKTSNGTDTYFTGIIPQAYEVVDPVAAELLGVTFDLQEVARGAQTVTASVTVRNSGGVALTCYVAGLTHLTGTSGWYPFSPTRKAVTLAPGETSIVDVTWAPSIGAPTGPYDFQCNLHKTSNGSDLWDSLLVTGAFTVIEPNNAAIVDMVCAPDQLELALGTITASVNVVNTGVGTFTLYLGGLAQPSGTSGYYLFSPTRKAVTLDAGQTDTVEVTWPVPAGAPMGTYDFICRLYKTSTGTDVYDEQTLPDAFMFYDPFTARGTVTVTLGPSGAVTAGARWRIDAGSWRQSGETASDLSIGFHYIDFLAVPGWGLPNAFSLNLNPDEDYQAVGDYPQVQVLLTVELQGGQVVVQWPGTVTGAQLETCPAVESPGNWVPVPGVQISDGQYVLDPVDATGFFRLGSN